MAIRYLHELAEITAKEVIIKNPSDTIGFTHLGTIHNNSGNNYIRGSIVFSRNKNDVTWNSSNAEWTRNGGSSNDFSAILHTSASVRFLAGPAVSNTTTYTNTEFLDAFEYMRASTSGNVTFYNNVETRGEFTIRGNYAKLFFQDTESSSEDAYIVNNADGLFFGKTNTPTASNDILKLDLSDSSAVFSGIIKTADGSASTPAYNFSSHDGNGMYLEEYDATNNKEQVSISTDGSRRFKTNEAGVWSENNFYVTGQYRKLVDDWWEGSHGVAGRGFRFRNTTDGTIPFTVTSAGVLYGKAAGGSALYLQRDDTTISGTNTLGSINFQGDDPTDGTFNSGAAIFATSDGSWASGSYPGRLDFQTRNTTGSLASALTLNKDQSATFAGRVDLQKDLRIRGDDATGSLGVVRFLTDADNQLIIDTGNDGANRTIIDGSGNADFDGNVTVGNNANISMDSSANGQLMIDGLGYQGAIALDDDAMHIYHNSNSRDLILGTNESARLTIDGGNGSFLFSDQGTITNSLLINAPDGGSAPAMTSTLKMYG